MLLLQEPARTHRTPLTDDELRLLDVLFDVDDTLEALRREHYASWHNLPYSHALDGPALERAIGRLLWVGLLRTRQASVGGRAVRWLGLTPAGGELWERERAPHWTRYCADCVWPEEGTGRWMLKVRSPSLVTARAFLETAAQCGLHAVTPRRVAIRRRAWARLLPWRRFATVYEVRALLDSKPLAAVDWALYERRRTWWRSILELGSLAA